MVEKIKRSVAKSVTFRILVIVANTIIIYLITHRIDETLGAIVLTSISSTILYYLHERVWSRISWGGK